MRIGVHGLCEIAFTENAKHRSRCMRIFTKEIIKNLPYDNYLLVTSGIHMKRSLLYFKSFNINVIPAISDDPKPLLWIPVSYNLTLMDFAIHEYFSIYRFYLYDFLNINYNSNKIFIKSAQ